MKRLFLKHYDRMLLEGQTAEDAADYASQRTHKGEYYESRVLPEAAFNGTAESREVRLKKGSGHDIKPVPESFKDIVKFYGGWLCCFETDFGRYIKGIERLGLDIAEILHKKAKYVSKNQAILDFEANHPGYVHRYDSVDWKDVHGFNAVQETGKGIVVTVLDSFKTELIPESMAGSIVTTNITKARNFIQDHGIGVSSVISHPIVGVSSDIKLILLDSSSCELIEDFSLPDSINSVDELLTSFNHAGNPILKPEILGQIGDIVNLSLGESEASRWDPDLGSSSIRYAFGLFDMIRRKNAIMVNAAGNYGSLSGMGFIVPKALARHESTRNLFISSTNLLDDGLHLSNHTDQPGQDKFLQMRTVSTIGKNIKIVNVGKVYDDAGTGEWSSSEIILQASGTSYSAPIVSAALALVLEHIRNVRADCLDAHELAVRAILESATPILVIPTTSEQRSRMNMLAEFSTPILLEGMMAKDLRPMKECKAYLAGEPLTFDITKEMIEDSRRRYGRGRLNVPSAMRWVNRQIWSR